MDFLQNFTNDHATKLTSEKDRVIRNAIEAKGINIDNLACLDLQVIVIEGDPFEHYYLNYGKDNEVRIISIARLPKIDFTQTASMVTFNATLNYY